jgi:hypothetical protein
MGQNKASVMLSSDEQDATRRANKKKRRVNANKTGAMAPVIPLGERIKQYDREVAQERREAAQRHRDALVAEREAIREAAIAAQVTFRRDQVTLASTFEEFDKLAVGSIAWRLAVAIFEAFLTVEPPKDKSVKRTTLAVQQALGTLTIEDRTRNGAISLGRGVAYRALIWAYDQLTAPVENTEPVTMVAA